MASRTKTITISPHTAKWLYMKLWKAVLDDLVNTRHPSHRKRARAYLQEEARMFIEICEQLKQDPDTALITFISDRYPDIKQEWELAKSSLQKGKTR